MPRTSAGSFACAWSWWSDIVCVILSSYSPIEPPITFLKNRRDMTHTIIAFLVLIEVLMPSSLLGMEPKVLEGIEHESPGYVMVVGEFPKDAEFLNLPPNSMVFRSEFHVWILLECSTLLADNFVRSNKKLECMALFDVNFVNPYSRGKKTAERVKQIVTGSIEHRTPKRASDDVIAMVIDSDLIVLMDDDSLRKSISTASGPFTLDKKVDKNEKRPAKSR